MIAPADWGAGQPLLQGVSDDKTGNRSRVPSAGTQAFHNAVRTPASSTPSSPESHYKTAVKKTVVSIGAAAAFGAATWMLRGRQSGMEFYAAYVVEQSLSVDNLFVFLMLFEYFSVPLEYQGRVLTWGIIGAVVMRGFMIAAGVVIVQSFRWVIVLFAGILIVSAYKLFTENEEEHDLQHNGVVKLAKRLVGAVDAYDGERFFTSADSGGLLGGGGSGGGGVGKAGRRVATPLLLCLVCIELSDFVFAVDSIPAVLGVSQDPFIVYSSNIFAIMALRSIYTLIARAAQQLPYLKPAVAAVLFFVGAKMLLEFCHVKIGTGLSLIIVVLLLSGGVLLSVLHRGGGLDGFFSLFGGRKRKNSDSAEDSHTDVIV